MNEVKTCINCGKALVKEGDILLCPACNSDELSRQPFLSFETGETEDFVYIECHGATLYEPGSNEVVQGVDFHEDDPSGGYRIVERAVYAPTHTRRRRIKRDAIGKIRRCQGCQDYTVRMRRKEGPDFFIPSRKYPGRTKLRSVGPH
jgi:hypothetical protein